MSFFSGQIWTPDQHIGVDARFRDDLLPANEGPNTAEHELEYRYLYGHLGTELDLWSVAGKAQL